MCCWKKVQIQTISICIDVYYVHLSWRQMDREIYGEWKCHLCRKNPNGIPVTSLFPDKLHNLNRWCRWPLPEHSNKAHVLGTETDSSQPKSENICVWCVIRFIIFCDKFGKTFHRASMRLLLHKQILYSD